MSNSNTKPESGPGLALALPPCQLLLSKYLQALSFLGLQFLHLGYHDEFPGNAHTRKHIISTILKLGLSVEGDLTQGLPKISEQSQVIFMIVDKQGFQNLAWECLNFVTVVEHVKNTYVKDVEKPSFIAGEIVKWCSC